MIHFKRTERIISKKIFGPASVLFILLPCILANDIIVRQECDESASEMIENSGERTGGIRCGRPRQRSSTDASSGGNLGTGDGNLWPALGLTKEQYEERVRRRETWRQILMTRLWEARRSPSVYGTPLNLHDVTGLRDFEALLETENRRNEREEREQDALTASLYWPQCSGPRNFVGTWNNGNDFRLFFNVEAVNASHRSRDIKILSAFLLIKRKPVLASGSHRPALTSARATAGAEAGTVTIGRNQARRRRPTRDTEDTASSYSVSSMSPSSLPPSSSFSRFEGGSGAANHMKIIVHSLSRSNKRSRQETRTLTFPRSSTAGWLRINLTHLAEDWIKRPSRNFGIQVTLKNDDRSSSEELDLEQYFEGIHCTTPPGQSSPVQLPLSSLEESVGHSEWISFNSDNGITHPFLEVVTAEVPLPRARSSRHQRDLEHQTRSYQRIEDGSDDMVRFNSLIMKWLQDPRRRQDTSSSLPTATPSKQLSHRSRDTNSADVGTKHLRR